MEEQNQNRWGKHDFTLLNLSVQFPFLFTIYHGIFMLAGKLGCRWQIEIEDNSGVAGELSLKEDLSSWPRGE